MYEWPCSFTTARQNTPIEGKLIARFLAVPPFWTGIASNNPRTATIVSPSALQARIVKAEV